MEFTELTMKVLYIFLPGIIVALIYFRLTTQLQKTPFFFLVYSFIFGMLSYIIVAAVYYIVTEDFYLYPLRHDISQPIDANHIFFALVLSFPLGFMMSLISNKKFLFKLASKINCSNQNGYYSIWEEFFETIDEGQYVTIRDLKNNLMYQGCIKSFSQTGEDRELIINDVLLFDNLSGNDINQEPYSEVFLSIPMGENYIVEVIDSDRKTDSDRKEVFSDNE